MVQSPVVPREAERTFESWCAYYRLSPAERELVRAQLVGKSFKEVAAQQGVSISTLYKYNERILEKTGAVDRLDAILRLLGVRVPPTGDLYHE